MLLLVFILLHICNLVDSTFILQSITPIYMRPKVFFGQGSLGFPQKNLLFSPIIFVIFVSKNIFAGRENSMELWKFFWDYGKFLMYLKERFIGAKF